MLFWNSLHLTKWLIKRNKNAGFSTHFTAFIWVILSFLRFQGDVQWLVGKFPSSFPVNYWFSLIPYVVCSTLRTEHVCCLWIWILRKITEVHFTGRLYLLWLYICLCVCPGGSLKPGHGLISGREVGRSNWTQYSAQAMNSLWMSAVTADGNNTTVIIWKTLGCHAIPIQVSSYT